METTIHLYGKDAKQKKEYLIELYKKYASNTKTFKDIHGKEWDVTIKINFDDVNSETIDNQIKMNGLDESQVPIVDYRSAAFAMLRHKQKKTLVVV